MSQIKLKHSGGNSVIIAAPDSNPASDRTLKLPSNADGTVLTTTNPKAGNIIQVVSTTKTDTFSHTGSTSFVDVTGLSVSITPTNASNKILVFYDCTYGSTSGHSFFKLVRGSTDIKIGDAASNRIRSTFMMHNSGTTDDYRHTNSAGSFLDSPNTTSATTYKIQVGTPYSSSYNIYVNRGGNNDDQTYNGRTSSAITVMEVAA